MTMNEKDYCSSLVIIYNLYNCILIIADVMLLITRILRKGMNWDIAGLFDTVGPAHL